MAKCTLRYTNLRNRVKNTLNVCNQSPMFTALVCSPWKDIKRLQENIMCYGDGMGKADGFWVPALQAGRGEE